MNKIEIKNNTSAESVAEKFAKWSDLNMTFAEGQSTATIELKISNVATEEDNYIDITALADATTKDNARIKVQNNAGGITALLKSGENATFTITFSVIDDEYKASLNDFSVNFNMQKKVLADFDSYDADSRITIECDTSAKIASVTGNNITQANTELEIPTYVKSGDVVCAVTKIEDGVFSYCGNLSAITIPASVTNFGNAFSFSGLTNITIPNSITNIPIDAFFGCTSLTSITIPDSVTSIGNRSFADCSDLTSITIPDSVTSIGASTFDNCSSLTSIEIPNSVTSIGYGAFCRCSGLTSIKVEDGNSVYDSRNNCNAIIETATNKLIAGCKNTVIPNTVEAIGEVAFSGCKNLTSIEIPNSVTSIGDNAFYECTGLTSIEIPNSVTSIGEWAFGYCSVLASITIPNTVTSIGDYAFYRCTSLTKVNYRGTQEEWNALLENVGSNNDNLINATLIPNYTEA